MFGGKTAEGFWAGGALRLCNKTVFGRRQNHTAAHADVGKQKIVVGNDDIDGFQNIARQVKRAFRTVGTGGFQAAVAVVGHLSQIASSIFSGPVSRSPLKRRAENSSAMSRSRFNSSGLVCCPTTLPALQNQAGFAGHCFCVS